MASAPSPRSAGKISDLSSTSAPFISGLLSKLVSMVFLFFFIDNGNGLHLPPLPTGTQPISFCVNVLGI